MLYHMGDSRPAQNIQINKVTGKNENVSFILQKNHRNFWDNLIYTIEYYSARPWPGKLSWFKCLPDTPRFQVQFNWSPGRVHTRINQGPWLMWLSGLGVILQTKRSLVWCPARAHAWVAGQVPGWGCWQPVRSYQSMFLSHIDASLPIL